MLPTTNQSINSNQVSKLLRDLGNIIHGAVNELSPFVHFLQKKQVKYLTISKQVQDDLTA